MMFRRAVPWRHPSALWSPALLLLLPLAGLAVASCVGRGAGSENCNNGVDDDGDGLADCLDFSCASDPVCAAGAEDCSNSVDDDQDSLIDCADSDCNFDPACGGAGEDCDNGVDDDGDGLADCDDSQCAAAIGCGAEICDDMSDNDDDGLIDCIDPECLTACIPEECTNGEDDNGDTLVDCADPDCATTFTDCVDEICDNGVEDDFDGLLDCLDEECALIFPGCIEDCTDGIDNDQDGYADCMDLNDCGTDPVCVEVVCTDGIDNEGDGDTDCMDFDCSGDPTCTAPGIYELFSAGTDLDNHTITFTPSGGDYTWAQAAATVFPTTPGTGSPTTAGCTSDDCTTLVSFGSLSLTLYGVAYTSGNLSSNGRLTLSTADTTYVESAAAFFTQPQIAALWDDLYLPGGGTLTADQFADRMVFTWNNIAEYLSTGNFCSMQIQWFTSGTITITHLSCTNPDGLVGISGGNPFGLPAPPAVNFVP